jgi:hypothetical protein
LSHRTCSRTVWPTGLRRSSLRACIPQAPVGIPSSRSQLGRTNLPVRTCSSSAR